MVEYLTDGTKVITHRMSTFVAELPTFSQWKLWQEHRPLHATMNADGVEEIPCVACGQGILYRQAWGAEKSKMFAKVKNHASIKVGGLVRMPKETRHFDRNERRIVIEKRFIPIPVNREGLGCGVCRALYEVEVTKCVKVNDLIRRMNTVNAHLATLRGKTFDSEAERAPFIDMFANITCQDCKNTTFVWAKDASKYVRCHCWGSK